MYPALWHVVHCFVWLRMRFFMTTDPAQVSTSQRALCM